MTEFDGWWARNHPLDWWAKERDGVPLPHRDRLSVLLLAQRAYAAGQMDVLHRISETPSERGG